MILFLLVSLFIQHNALEYYSAFRAQSLKFVWQVKQYIRFKNSLYRTESTTSSTSLVLFVTLKLNTAGIYFGGRSEAGLQLLFSFQIASQFSQNDLMKNVI